jgi:hypothetical protein
MPSRPWLRWYPGDWRADPRLRMCSLAARGLWIELLGFMHEAEPYGHFIVGGAAPSEREIAKLVGASISEAKRCVLELRNSGVFSTNPEGVIYSRRMVRDREKAERDRINGGAGGNPKLRPPNGIEDGAGLTPNSARLDHSVNRLDNGGVNPPYWPPDKAARAHAPGFQKPDTKLKGSEGSNEPSAATPALDSRKEVFDRGRAILGRNAGGMITNLLRHCDGDCQRVLEVLRRAESKSEPREYLGAVLRGDTGVRADEALAQTERLYRDLGVS